MDACMEESDLKYFIADESKDSSCSIRESASLSREVIFKMPNC